MNIFREITQAAMISLTPIKLRETANANKMMVIMTVELPIPAAKPSVIVV